MPPRSISALTAEQQQRLAMHMRRLHRRVVWTVLPGVLLALVAQVSYSSGQMTPDVFAPPGILALAFLGVGIAVYFRGRNRVARHFNIRF